MRWLALLCVALLVGCADLYPRVPWSDRSDLIDAGNRKLDPLDVDHSRRMVIGLHDLLVQAQSKRDLQTLIAQEVAFYGTLVAVGGIAFDSRAAQNIGGGVAGLTSVVSGHYHSSDQSLVFAKAAARADCLVEAFQPIDPALAVAAASTIASDPTLALAYQQIPEQSVEYVDKIGADLNAALNNITLSSPNKDDLATTMEGWKAKKAQKAPGSTTPDVAQAKNILGTAAPKLNLAVIDDAAAIQQAKELVDGYIAAVKDFKVDGDACLVQHTQ